MKRWRKGCKGSRGPLYAHDSPESRLPVARKHRGDIAVAQLPRDQFSQHVAKIGGQVQVAILIELLGLQARPIAINLAALDAAAEGEHHVGVAMIRAAIA